MPEFPKHRNVIPVQPTSPSRGPNQRRAPVARRDRRDEETDRQRPDKDKGHKIDEYA